MRNFLRCYYRLLITSIAFERCEREFNMLKVILVQGFCPLKIKIINFLMDSVLSFGTIRTWPSLKLSKSVHIFKRLKEPAFR